MQSAAARPISQRGMAKAISFTGGNRSEAMAILKYYLTNTTPQEFYAAVTTALSNRMILSTDIENFLSGLEGIGVATSSAHTAVRDNVFRHCLRCHQPYMERDNGPRSCIIPHIAHTIPAGTEVVQSPTVGVACCGAALSMSVTPISVHFMGRHTTSVENVEYNPINVKTCAECKCTGIPGNVVVSAERT